MTRCWSFEIPFLKDKYTVEYIWLGASSPRAFGQRHFPSDRETSHRQRPRLTPARTHLLRGSPGGNDGDLRSKTKTWRARYAALTTSQGGTSTAPPRTRPRCGQ